MDPAPAVAPPQSVRDALSDAATALRVLRGDEGEPLRVARRAGINAIGLLDPTWLSLSPNPDACADHAVSWAVGAARAAFRAVPELRGAPPATRPCSDCGRPITWGKWCTPCARARRV